MAGKRKYVEMKCNGRQSGDTDYVENSNKILKLGDKINKERSSGAFKKSAFGTPKEQKEEIECPEDLKIPQMSQRQNCERLNCFVMEKILHKVNVIDRIPLEKVSKKLRQISLNGFRFRGISLKIVEQEQLGFRFLKAKRNLVAKNWSELTKIWAQIFSRARKIQKLELSVLNTALFSSAFLKALQRRNSNELKQFRSFSLKFPFRYFGSSSRMRKVFHWKMIEEFGHLFESLKLNFQLPLFKAETVNLLNIVSDKCKNLQKITYEDKSSGFRRSAIEFDRYPISELLKDECSRILPRLEFLNVAFNSQEYYLPQSQEVEILCLLLKMNSDSILSVEQTIDKKTPMSFKVLQPTDREEHPAKNRRPTLNALSFWIQMSHRTSKSVRLVLKAHKEITRPLEWACERILKDPNFDGIKMTAGRMGNPKKRMAKIVWKNAFVDLIYRFDLFSLQSKVL